VLEQRAKALTLGLVHFIDGQIRFWGSPHRSVSRCPSAEQWLALFQVPDAGAFRADRPEDGRVLLSVLTSRKCKLVYTAPEGVRRNSRKGATFVPGNNIIGGWWNNNKNLVQRGT
jgi:hypothetical protein